MRMDQVTGAIANPYSGHSVSSRARAKRWDEVLRRFPNLADMRVVDLGGDIRHWESCPVRPRKIVFVNLYPQPEADGHRVIVADACTVPSELTGDRFDLAYSNSVIEHVGGHERRTAFADVTRRLGERYWVQTPYRYFPVEPHWLFPGLQFLPTAIRVRVTERWPLGHRQATGRDATENVLSVELLGRTELRHYFPDADIWTESLAGLPKSLVAVRGGGSNGSS
jgi:hypothetical protein